MYLASAIVMLMILNSQQTPDIWSTLNLPDEHIPYYLNNNNHLKQLCREDASCPYQNLLQIKKCWGYEKGCKTSDRMSEPKCPGDLPKRVKTKDDQVQMFWSQGDFGYVKKFMSEMITLCEPQLPGDSSLVCAKHTHYCYAENLYLDFRGLQSENSRDRYKEDIFKAGDIGGHCKLDQLRLQAQGDYKSPLQSWYAELQHYTSLDFRPVSEDHCDVIIQKPTFFIKLDAGINMYHHFCDFINLYASQHINNSFSTDIYIVMWDTSRNQYGDFFHQTWKAFTDYPIIHLKDYDGKKVCFREAIFSLLARMRLGLYYNMPLIPGCQGSSLFRAFSQHILHRLDIGQSRPSVNKVRITLLDRASKYRNILNQNELVNAMRTVGRYDVRVVKYDRNIPFPDQLRVTHNSDVFLCMHGAGLTHMLFLPDWAVVFEVYNCDDSACYFDLARLRGIKYITWEKPTKVYPEDEGHHPTLGAHAKFTNYAFDVTEFMRLITIASEYVESHPKFIQARVNKYKRRDEL